MRLTLRTLLAYRDGVLSQADYNDLHQRIQQSPDVGNLLRRINELTASSKIPTPRIDATGLASVNVIAEYLDDVLTSSRIAELERLCLEYSEHLCELAHCHQLLAQAMNTHVEVSEGLYKKALSIVDPATREQARSQLLTQSRKMSKQIIAEVVEVEIAPGAGSSAGEASTTTPSGASSVSENVVSSTSASQPKTTGTVLLATVVPAASSPQPQQAGLNLEGASLSTEVPEYLLGSRKRRWQIPAAILALSTVLAFLVWQSIGGSLDVIRSLMIADGSEQKVTGEQSPQELSSKEKEIGESGPKNNGDANQGNKTAVGEANDLNGDHSNNASQSIVEKSNPTGDGLENAGGNSDSAVGDSQSALTGSDKATIMTPNDPAESSDSVAVAPNLADLSSPGSIQPSTNSTVVWTPADEIEAQSVVMVTTPDGSKLIELGEEFSEGRFLLPPVARTTLRAGPIKMLAVGPSVMVLKFDNDQLQLSSSTCRALLSCESNRAKFSVQSPCGLYHIEILDKAVWLGLEISYRKVNKGSTVEADTFAPVMILIVGVDTPAQSPELVKIVKGDNDQSVTINSPAQGIAVVKTSQMETFSLQSPPAWYRKRSVRAIDQLGMSDFALALRTSNEPLADRIRALAADNRPEVAALAIQTAMLRGDWQPFAENLLLNDRMRAHWNSSLDLARQLITGRPDSQQELQHALQAKLGSDADRCAELVVGLSAANQNNEGLLGLVKGLDAANNLPLRILSFYELKHLTGEDFSYQPHAPVRAAIQQWRSRVVQNKAFVLPISDPVYERVGK